MGGRGDSRLIEAELVQPRGWPGTSIKMMRAKTVTASEKKFEEKKKKSELETRRKSNWGRR